MKKIELDELFNKISSDYGSKLERVRRKLIIKSMLLFLIVFFVSLYMVYKMPQLVKVIVYATIFAFLICIAICKKMIFKYKKNYKDKVIKYLVKNSNDECSFNAKGGVTKEEYLEPKMNTKADKVEVEDLIEGTLEKNTKIKMSQVKAFSKHETEDTCKEICDFYGLYGIFTLPVNTEKNIRIYKNSKIMKFNESRIEMESSKFEKYYDVFSKDRQGVMELISSKTIEALIKVKEEFKESIEIEIVNDKIYFKLECGNIFEPPTIMNAMNYKLMNKYFKIIELPKEIYEIADSIVEKLNQKD